MELITQLKELQEKNLFDAANISQYTNQEELLFNLRDAVVDTPNYEGLYDLFELIRENTFENGGVNVFQEYLSIKLVYFKQVYDFDSILMQSLITLMGPVKLDFILEKDFLQNDEFYSFFIKRYEDFKHNNELSILKMLKDFDFGKLSIDSDQLMSALGEIQKYIPKEDLE